MPPGRRCPATGCPTIITTNARYCPTHQHQYDTRRGTPTTRGYDTPHRNLRATYQAQQQAGKQLTCWRCQQPITTTHWHLGHHDTDRTKHMGPEHETCNTKAAGKQSGGKPKPERK